MALEERPGRPGEQDKPPRGELDYDALLAHYREKGILDGPMEPAPARDKKKLSLHPSAPNEGKFAKKRGDRPARQQPDPPAEPKKKQRPAPAEQPRQEEDPEESKPAPKPREGKRRWLDILSRPKPEGKGEEEQSPEEEVSEDLSAPGRPAPPGEPEPVPPPPAKERRHRDRAAAAAVLTEPLEEAAEKEEEEPEPRPKKERFRPGLLFGKKKEKETPQAPEEEPQAPALAETEEPERRAPGERDKARNHREEPTLLEWVYIEVYYIGVQLMRDMNFLHRRWQQLADWMAYQVPRWFQWQHQRFLRVCTHISDTTLFPYRELAKLTGRLFQNLRDTKKEKGALGRKLGLWWQYFRSLSRPLNHIANFIAPIVGITILAATLTYFRGINYALSVEYSGQHLGYIAQESIFYDAQQTVLDRMLSEEYQPPEDSQPIFHIVIADEEDLLDTETLANRILAASLNEVEEADGVYIEGAFLGALEDGNEILIYLDSLLDAYRSGIDHELVQFVKSISVRRGIYPRSSVRPLYRITQDMQSDQTRTVEHKVEEGQTLTSIAEDYNVPVTQLLELNTLLEERDHKMLPAGEGEEEQIDPESIALTPGETLTIARVSMDLGVQVTRREVYDEEIPYGTTNIEDSRYYKGYAVPISAGVNGLQTVTADVTYIDGEKVAETRIGTPEVLREPVNAQVRVGTMAILTYLDPSSTGSNSYLWPVKGGYVSAGLYGYYGHTGMDIAAPYGTEIRAARDGQVTYATNYSIWPYGKRVDISHGDGAITRYAHCSSVFVTYGQYVRQGDLIALVGRTGNASGNHCHFEIRINGVVMNPANFVGTYWPGF